MKFTTKDSGARQDYDSGMRRDLQTGKANLYLWIPQDIPYEHNLWTRIGELAARGAEKYGERNCDLANSQKELERFKASALRHMMQWLSNMEDEDHAAATFFNILQAENVKYRLREKNTSDEKFDYIKHKLNEAKRE